MILKHILKALYTFQQWVGFSFCWNTSPVLPLMEGCFNGMKNKVLIDKYNDSFKLLNILLLKTGIYRYKLMASLLGLLIV